MNAVGRRDDAGLAVSLPHSLLMSRAFRGIKRRQRKTRKAQAKQKAQTEHLVQFRLKVVHLQGLGRGAASEKARGIRLFSTPWSVAALTTVQVVIHYRSSSSPFRCTLQNKKGRRTAILLCLVHLQGLEPWTH